MPKDAELTQALRRVVREALSTGEEITVNGARQRVEEELDLDEDFFKSDAKWKSKSKEIILAAFESAGDEPEEAKPRLVEKKVEGKAKAQAKKRKSEETAPQPVKKRRRKNAVVEESDDDEEEDGSEVDYDEQKSRDTSNSDDDDDDDQDQDESEEITKANSKSKSKTHDPAPARNTNDANDSESDMSVLIDDPPPKKRQPKKSSTPSDPSSKSKPKSSTNSSSSPDDEEIKRLQSWLVKCGIRKVWSRELASFSSSKDKIRHLKKLLSDAGMTGRYSAEKARSIKEARELQAEIQSAQEFNEVFGATKDEGSEGEGSGKGEGETRGRRARPRGFVDFGDSGDEGSD